MISHLSDLKFIQVGCEAILIKKETQLVILVTTTLIVESTHMAKINRWIQ